MFNQSLEFVDNFSEMLLQLSKNCHRVYMLKFPENLDQPSECELRSKSGHRRNLVA